jgi:hypothetical protein
MMFIMKSIHTPAKAIDNSRCAQYMVLLGPAETPRALLFDRQCHYLAEMFDEDGLLVDQLVKSSRVCPPPRGLMLDDVMPPPAAVAADALRCFALS